MSLQIGQQLGSYQIISLIGKGGMGEVYRAKDTKLKRDVAIKILPDEFSRDTDRVARFQREAESLAALNHQNIAAIYDLQQSDTTRFLILEFVEGDTLAETLKKRGALPVEEALQIAKQICEALEAAHEKGIIHRDLKPANIKVAPDGRVKVLDFGLAKSLQKPQRDFSDSPTFSMAATNAGVILGTAAYMSPEQARGEDTDERSDVFSFGSVLYEMLSGRQAFQGKTVSDILAGVLRVEPDFTLSPPDLNPRLYELLRRCLDKNPKRRWQAVGDLKIELETVAADPYRKPQISTQHPAPPRRRLEHVLWISALASISMIAAAAFIWASRRAPPAPEMRVEISTPPTTTFESLEISPDGQKIVFAAGPRGRSVLWLRSLDSLSARPLEGTDNATYPFWSPDSRTVGFFAKGKLQRIDIEGGSPRVLADAGNGRGGTWNRDGVILFAPNPAGPLFRISATGGQPTTVTRIDAAQQISHRFPKFLPDSRHFLYYVQGSPESNGVYIGQLEGSSTPRLFDADAAATYASSGYLLFVLQGTLFAQHFDPDKLVLTGDPLPVADQIAVNYTNQDAAVSASAAGPVVYRTGSESPRQLVWIDRSGREIEKVGAPDPTRGSNAASNPSLSLDGRRVALSRTVNGNADIWIQELERSVLSRFTFDAAVDSAPIWSPDSNQIVFASRRKGVRDLYLKPARGAGGEQLLLATPETKDPVDWSPDGRFLLYGAVDPRTGNDIWALPMSGANASPTGRSHQELDGDRKPFPVVQTNFNEHSGQFSPDGKWIAYESNESGRYEIYIQLFPGPGGKTQISTNGGSSPRWRRDSKELFYLGPDDRLMAVPIRFASNGQTLEPGTPVPLFVTRFGRGAGYDAWDYVVAPDGQRFLMNTSTEEAVTSPIVLLMNWHGK
jgi:serine/threonine protein kinase